MSSCIKKLTLTGVGFIRTWGGKNLHVDTRRDNDLIRTRRTTLIKGGQA